METKKITVACFIGGALCCAVALMFAPVYWWFGLIAGMAGGYISYEFRDVRRAIPIALRATGRGSMYAWDGIITLAKAWLSRSHPFFYPAAVVVAPFYLWVAYHIVPLSMQNLTRGSLLYTIIMIPIFCVDMVGVFFFFACLAFVLLFTLAFIGARVGERCFWLISVGPLIVDEEGGQVLKEKGLRQEPLIYQNVARWAAKGLGLTVMFFVWTLWKYVAIYVWATLCFLSRFAWYLFKLIHSEKRVLCAIDGTLGGAVNYIWLASASMLFMEQALLVIFGGLLGAAFGIANWEIVSKQILHVSDNGTA